MNKASTSLALGITAAIATAIPATLNAQVVMNASDAINTTSLNAAGHWSDGLAPSAGKNYSTAGYLLRTPSTSGNYTFAGDSLTVGAGSGAGAYSQTTANNNALIFKAASTILTVNNIILDGSQIRDGDGSGQWVALNGNIFVTANGGAFMAQATNIINSAISGSGTIAIGSNGSGEAARVVEFTSGASTFNGNILMSPGNANAAYSRLWFTAGSVMNFTIGANGINNNISGIGTLTLDGAFNFDLTGADNTVGNSWSIVAPGVVTAYDPTFSVNGFSQFGNFWVKSAGANEYQYDPSSGLLSVIATPEPSSFALSGLILAGFAIRSRRKA